MKGNDFCPLCGSEKARFIKGLCEGCFLKKNTLVEMPALIEVPKCNYCGKARISGKISSVGPEKIAALVQKKVRLRDFENATVDVSVAEEEDGRILARVLVKGVIENVPLSIEKTVPVEFAGMQCDACMRLSSHYYAAVIQLRPRGDGRKMPKRLLQKTISLVESGHSRDALATVTEVTEKKEGFDLKVGSKKAARNAVNRLKSEYGAETKASTELIGIDKSGKEKRRFTFLVRV